MSNSITQQPVRDSNDPPQRRSSVNNNDSVPRWATVGKQLFAELVFRTAAMPRFVFRLGSVLKSCGSRGYRPDRSINLVPVKLVGLRKAYG